MASPKMFLFIMLNITILCCILTLTLSAAPHTAHSTVKQPILPLNSQPLRVTNILLDIQQTASTSSLQSTSLYQPIHTLSTDSIEYFSTTSSVNLTEAELNAQFYPFGKNMYFSFQTHTPQSLQTLNNDDIDDDIIDQTNLLLSTQLHEFYLEIDDSPIFSSKERASSFVPAGDIITEEMPPGKSRSYDKHTSFKGKRINANGIEEMLVLTVIPNVGDFLQSEVKINNNLETQNIQQQQQFTPQSGRMGNQYTIEGFLTQGEKTYQITTYTTLAFQVQSEYYTTQSQLSSQSTIMDAQSINAMMTQMDIMSTLMDTLNEQRNDASYDLAIVEIDLDRLPGDCGVDHDHSTHTDNHTHEESSSSSTTAADIEQFQHDPLSMSPSWILARWKPSCNPYIGRVVVFPMKVFASYSYQLYCSGSKTDVNPAAVTARTKLLLQIINMVTQQQMGFIWRLVDIIAGSATGSQNWNAKDADDDRCKLDNLKALDSLANERPKNLDVAALHGLVTCASTGVVGIATVGVLCQPTQANGISSINGMYSWTTFAHELQHQVGAQHPFGSDTSKVGSFGGLMDYFNIRLPPKDANPKRFGFNQATDTATTCPGIQSVLKNTPGLVIANGACYVYNNRNIINDFCGNGIIEPWEECDSTNACCNKCKLATGATCATDNECCISCTTSPPKRCSMPGDTTIKTGICSTGGQCTQSNCGDLSTKWTGNQCTDADFFQTQQAPKCGYICPDASCKGGLLSSRTNLDPGSSCYDQFGAIGICVETQPFNVDQRQISTTATCTTNIEYSWKYTVVSQCDCVANLDLIDTYNCVNSAGTIVSSSFCEKVNATKQARDTCCCNPPCAQDNVAWGGSPNNTVMIQLSFVLIAMIFAIVLF